MSKKKRAPNPFTAINKRLKRLGSTVTVLADAAKDKNRHRLVQISCSRCGIGTKWRPAETKTMRLADLTRKVHKNKTGKRVGPSLSCGCLKFESYQSFRQSRKRSGPLHVVRQWVESPFWAGLFDEGLGCPLLICIRALQKGGFTPAVPIRLTSEPAMALAA